MSLDGRSEKRDSFAVPVYFGSALGALAAERAVTVNFSSRGARILTRRRWEPEEKTYLVSFSRRLLLQGRVVYCQALDSQRYAVGLQFPYGHSNWRDALR